MDWQSAFNIAAGILGAIGGWLLNNLWSAVERLRRDLNALEVSINSSYLKRDDFNQALERIEDKIDRMAERIYTKLDEKMDRS